MGVMLFIGLLCFGIYSGVVKGKVLDGNGNISGSASGKEFIKEFGKYFAIGLIVLMFFGGIKLVSVGQAGIVFNRFTGMTDKKLQEGFNWVNPLTDRVKVYSIKVTKS